MPAEHGVFSPAESDSDGQLCGLAPAQDEEPACPDEFDDFVTFEASGFYWRAGGQAGWALSLFLTL